MGKNFYKYYIISIILCIVSLLTYEYYYTEKYNEEIAQLELEVSETLKENYMISYKLYDLSEKHYQLSHEYDLISQQYIKLKLNLEKLNSEMEEKMNTLGINKL